VRIYDNPEHPQYGPVRRLWVVLTQLDMLEDAERHRPKFEPQWDVNLATMVHLGVDEHVAQRVVLNRLLERVVK